VTSELGKLNCSEAKTEMMAAWRKIADRWGDFSITDSYTDGFHDGAKWQLARLIELGALSSTDIKRLRDDARKRSDVN
jgi:hypothetical protein